MSTSTQTSSPIVSPTDVDAILAPPALAWSTFLFAFLQSICAGVIAINGLRLAIGLGSLALSFGTGAAMVWFHSNWIRIPMVLFAFLGAALNLAIYFHVRHLRNRPASQWRQKPLTPGNLRKQRLQLFLSLVTLLLVGLEEYLHFGFHHTL